MLEIISSNIDRYIHKYFYPLDPCAGVECSGDSNRCVDGVCVCGSTGDVCSSTRPLCIGDGSSAKCNCHPASCEEPNPICDPEDGTCKVGSITILHTYCLFIHT